MLRQRRDEDLFKDSTMTFGEHLEELRRCLFKAVLGLLVGMIAGFFVGSWVVDLIQQPLKNALEQHVITGTLSNFDTEIGGLQSRGHDLNWTKDTAETVVLNYGLLPEIVWVQHGMSAREPLPVQTTEAVSTPGEPKAEAPSAVTPAADIPTAEAPAAETPKPKLQTLEQLGLQPTVLWHQLADDRRLKPTALNAHEVFMIWLKASMLVGLVLASPWIFYQIWNFVAAGLYPHERRYINIYLPFSIVLFLAGVLMAYYGAFPVILKFLFSFNRSMGIEIDPRISEWLSFVLMLPLGFGVAFQLPLVMLFLQRIGVVTVPMFLSYWRVAILVIFGVAAILTPPDPWSMSLLALPLTVLYFGGILLCKWMPAGKAIFPVEEID
jgi:sec-independent protein translocase protein TatC